MQVIFFDLDGTLVDSTINFTQVFAQVIQSYGLDKNNDDVTRAVDSAWPWYENNLNLYHQKGERDFWWGFNRQVCLGLGAEEHTSLIMAEDITTTFRKLSLRKLYPDSIDCLNIMTERGFQLGVITARPDARDLIIPLGIEHYFSYIIDACSAKSAKSDERIYQYALDIADLRESTAFHVGDEIARDIMPAEAAGLLPILIDRHNKHADADHTRITQLSELPRIVSDLQLEAKKS